MSSKCTSRQFTCDNECLDLTRKCDKIRDCLDSSDEENCGYSSTLTSEIDQIAQLALFIGIGVLGLALLVILAAVFVICLRRSKQRHLSSVEVIQVPSHYIKTQDANHQPLPVISGSSNGSGNLYQPQQQQQQQQQLQGTTSDNYNGSEGEHVARARAASASGPRSHQSSRHSTRSRRSYSSGRSRRRHVAYNNDGSESTACIAQLGPSSATAVAAVSGDSGIATGSTVASTSGTFGSSGRPLSLHSSLHPSRQEAIIASIPAAFRHSFHGAIQEMRLRHHNQQLQQQQRPSNLPSENTTVPGLSAGGNTRVQSVGTLQTSPPPPYSTFDRTIYTGQTDDSVVTGITQTQTTSQSAAQRSSVRSCRYRMERNAIYGDTNAISLGNFVNNNLSNHQTVTANNRQNEAVQRSRATDYTRLWVERVSGSETTPAMPQSHSVTTSQLDPSTDDTVLNEQRYAQQIRLALRKNQTSSNNNNNNQNASTASPDSVLFQQSSWNSRHNTASFTNSPTVLQSDTASSDNLLRNHTPQSMTSSGLTMMNTVSSTTAPFGVTPSPTREAGLPPQGRHVGSILNSRPAIIKRPMTMHV